MAIRKNENAPATESSVPAQQAASAPPTKPQKSSLAETSAAAPARPQKVSSSNGPASGATAAPPAAAAPKAQKQQAPPSTEAPKSDNTDVTAPDAQSNENVENSDLFKEFVVIQDQMTAMTNAMKVFGLAMKDLHKKYIKVLKAGQKKQKKGGDAKGGAKRTNGFSLPVKLSDDMCKFMGIPSGTHVGRTDVTKALTKYIKENDLQDKEDKRNILPDAKLKAVLSSTDQDKVTYFNLQKFIKHHFIKDETTPTK